MPGIAAAVEMEGHRGGIRPLVPKLLASMPDDLRLLAETLLNSDHSDQFVAAAFTEDGYKVSQNAIRNHRQVNRLSRFA